MAQGFLLLQMTVPALLVWIALDAIRGGIHGRLTQALLTVAAIWLAAGLSLVVMRSRPRVARWIPKINLAALSAIACFVLLEIAVSIVFPICRFGVSRFPRPPHLRVEIGHNTEAIPGQAIRTVFSTNEIGLRGPTMASSEGAYRVLAIGASATEAYLLDDSMAWPHLLEQQFERDRGGRAWVQNAGVSGHTVFDHLLMLKSSPVTAGADLVLILAGVNDLTAILAFEGRSIDAGVVHRADESFGLFPLYSRSALFKLFKVLRAEPTMRYDEVVDFYRERRRVRRTSLVLPLPSLELGTREYGERIRQIVVECKARGKRCVLMTQPTLWRDDLTKEESDSLWLGWLGPLGQSRGFASIADLEAAMNRLNTEMIRVGTAEGVEVYDLAAHVPKTRTMFYDDCHYTNEGSRRVAESVAGYLKSISHVAKG